MEPDRDKRILEEVQHTMGAHSRLESDPFFYQKLKTRMEEELLAPKTGTFQLAWIRPVASAAFMVLSIGYSLSVMLSNPTVTTATDDKDLVEQLAEEFYVEDNSDQGSWHY